MQPSQEPGPSSGRPGQGFGAPGAGGHDAGPGFLPTGAPGPMIPGAGHSHGPHYQPQFTRTILNVGAPTGGLIAAGVATALALGFNFFQNPALAILGGVLAGLASLVVVLAYLWLDRWEPEPPRLLLFAWLWGGVAVVFSLITSLFDTDVFVSTVIRAPIVEELAKGAFLVLMLTGVRRREVNTLTDCIVYAGMVGGAFGFIENVLYLARGETVTQSLAIAVVRLSTPFLHPFFTTLTAIGLYVGLSKTSKSAQWGFLGLGYAGAVVLHMIWNATGMVAHILLFLPLFGGAVALAIVTRNREQKLLLAQLPRIVESGLIRPDEAAWLATLQGRKVWRTHVAQFSGPEAKKQVERLGGEVTELAFARARAERGTVSSTTLQRIEELTAAILGQPRPPVPPGPAPQPPTLSPALPPPQETTWSPVPAPPQGWGPGPGRFPSGGPGQGSAPGAGPAPAGAVWPAQVPPGPGPYPGQPYPGQPYPGQPYPGQPYPGRPFAGSGYPGQTAHPGQPHPGQPPSGPPLATPGAHPGQSHPGQPTGARPIPGQPPNLGQPGQVHGADQEAPAADEGAPGRDDRYR